MAALRRLLHDYEFRRYRPFGGGPKPVGDFILTDEQGYALSFQDGSDIII